MASARHREQRRTPAVSAWLTTGATTLGVGAALLSGAAAANAKPTTDSTHSESSASSTNSSSSDSSSSSSTGSSKKAKSSKPKVTTNKHASTDSDAGAKSAAATASADKTDKKAGTSLSKHVTKQAATAATTAATTQPAASTSTETKTAAATASTKSVASAAAVVTAAATSTSSATPSGASSTTTSTPTRSADFSGVLSVLAAFGQALTVSARNTELTLTGAVHNTSLTVSNALNSLGADLTALTKVPAAATTTTTTTPAAGTSAASSVITNTTSSSASTVAQAITEIQAAQAAYASTPKSGNWWTNFTNQQAAGQLKVALNNLTKYQANQDTLLATYAASPTSANLKALQANENLTNSAISALKNAKAWSTISGIKTNAAAAATDALTYASVPLGLYLGTEPIVKISINGGPMVKVLIDTGSTGLVIPAKYVGSTGSLVDTGVSGTSGYGTGVGSAAVTYKYEQYDTTVSFGTGLNTDTVTINVVSADTQSAYMNYIGQNGVVGVLGIGTNAVGPGGDVVTQHLHGVLSSGFYLNEKTKTLSFGLNPLPVVKSASGTPYTTGYISVDGGATKTAVNLLTDTGGVYGTIPASAIGLAQSDAGKVLAAGTVISVYNSDGTLLYSYTTTSTNTPTITKDTPSSNLTTVNGVKVQGMNTGYAPFKSGPVYINYTTGSTTVTYIVNGSAVTSTFTGQTDYDY